MAQIITPEQASELGFKNLQFGRHAIKSASTVIVLANDMLWAAGNVLCRLESVEHLQEVLKALRAEPIDD